MLFRTLLLALFVATSANAANSKENLDQAAQAALAQHFNQYKEKEYFSGASLSISVPGDSIHNYYIGNISHDKNSAPVTAETLFEIGSITKSFTAALMLQLDGEKLLNLQDATEKYLPAYAKWGKASLDTLLNMTSCLPNYSDAPLMNAAYANDIARVFSNEELLAYSYPKKDFNPPIKTGYMYSNTGYVLSDMIIAKVTNSTYKEQMQKRLITSAGLSNTFYPIPDMSEAVSKRMAHGNGFNPYVDPELVGRDLFKNSLSWAAAAGGIVATTEDVVKWINALFVEDKILNAAQKQKMMTVVSTQTGLPVKKLSASDNKGFGLGVVNLYNAKFPREDMWIYEGQTTGFRVLYIYVPCNKVIVAAAFNSATNGENDHAHDLLQNAYALLIKQQPALRCHG